MNVNGRGTLSQAPPAMTIVPAPSPTDRAPTEAARTAAPSAEVTKPGADKTAEEKAAKLPPLKGLTVNEVRMMLGALPVSEAAKTAANPNTRPSIFDVYA